MCITIFNQFLNKSNYTKLATVQRIKKYVCITNVKYIKQYNI